MQSPTALAGLATSLFLLLPVYPGQAHHSVAHDFDVFRTVQLQGKLIRINWGNPHIGLELLVRNADGSTSFWRIEGGPPNALLRRGWTRQSLTPGAEVRVDGWPARDGSRRANARDITLDSGITLDAASSYIHGSGSCSKPHCPD